MLKIGDHELTMKELAAAGVFILVAVALVWWMVGSKPKPVVLKASAQPGVLLEGGQPGAQPGQFSYPRGIAVDKSGDIYVADSRNHRIQKFDGKSGKLSVGFGGFFRVDGGDVKKTIATAPGKLNEPNGVAIGPDDAVYVVDTWNGRVQIFSPKGKHKKTIAAEDGFFAPRELAVDPNGFVYVADTGKHRIVKFDPKGQKVRAWGVKGDGKGDFNEPIGLAIDQSGNLYVADRLNYRIQVFNPDGEFLRKWDVKGWSKEQIDMEPHLALDRARSLIYASDGRGKRVNCFKLDGTPVATLEADPQGRPFFQVPLGVAVDQEGNLYVVDAGLGKILKLKGQP
jgi:DNA-binding beta-propeller fold protein YncE